MLTRSCQYLGSNADAGRGGKQLWALIYVLLIFAGDFVCV